MTRGSAAQSAGNSRFPDKLFDVLVWAQAVYYTVTGVWPLVSVETFQAVTGPKTDHLITGREGDHFLLMTVGALITAIGCTLLIAAWRRTRVLEVAILAMASAVALTAIDVIYVARDVIPPIYLADAVAEIILIAGWLTALVGGPSSGGAPDQLTSWQTRPAATGERDTEGTARR